MKHSELYASHPTPGQTPSTCPGELKHMWTRSDTVFVEHAAAVHQVALYLCLQCGRSVSFDETSGQVRNEYQAVNPVMLVACELKAGEGTGGVA